MTLLDIVKQREEWRCPKCNTRCMSGPDFFISSFQKYELAVVRLICHGDAWNGTFRNYPVMARHVGSAAKWAVDITPFRDVPEVPACVIDAASISSLPKVNAVDLERVNRINKLKEWKALNTQAIPNCAVCLRSADEVAYRYIEGSNEWLVEIQCHGEAERQRIADMAIASQPNLMTVRIPFLMEKVRRDAEDARKAMRESLAINVAAAKKEREVASFIPIIQPRKIRLDE